MLAAISIPALASGVTTRWAKQTIAAPDLIRGLRAYHEVPDQVRGGLVFGEVLGTKKSGKGWNLCPIKASGNCQACSGA